MFPRLSLALLCLLCPAFAYGQGFQIRDVAQKLVNGNYQPAIGASVTVCTSAGTGIPCTPLASIYLDKALTQPSANPIIVGTSSNSDALGNFNFYVSPTASYVTTITGSGFTGRSSTYQLACPTDVNCTFTGTLTNTGSSATFCRFENIRYVDPTNICGWAGSDYGAWVMSAIADLPTVTVNGGVFRQGKIVLAPGGNLAITQSTTVTINSLFVAVEGPGPQELILSCTVNADCWQIRDVPWTNNRGSKIGGFTVLGQGAANANANGMHVGDINNARFENISIDNFLGVNSSCMWWDNQSGWSERNIMTGLELGAHTATAGEIENGCTKLLRFTTSVNANAPSFGYNEWYGIRMGLKVSGQIGWSLEAVNPFNLYFNSITGNANMVAGTTLFSITGTQGAGGGNWIFLRAESTGAATGWSTAASPPTPFTFIGPGIVRNSAAITDSIGASSLVNLSGVSQTASATGCTTGASQFNTCDTVLTWPVPFLDANYQVVCNGDGFVGTLGVLQGADMNGAKTATTVNVRTVTLNASTFQFSKITCTATRQGL